MFNIADLEVGRKIKYTSRGKAHTGTIKSLHTDDTGAVCWVRVGSGIVNVMFIQEVLS